jgi:hypothetical protein
MWTISGNAVRGYRILTPDGEPSPWHFAYVSDAVAVRDAINRGELVPSRS